LAETFARIDAEKHIADVRVERVNVFLQAAHANLIPVHLPIHASWLNQIEIYFSILQRKVLTPPRADSLNGLAADIVGFQAGYEVMAKPFRWKFTRDDLNQLLQRLPGSTLAQAAA